MSPLLARANGNMHVLMPVRGSLPPELEEEQERRRQKAEQEDSTTEEESVSEPTEEDKHEEEPTPTRREINRMIQPKKNTDDQPDLWTQYQTIKEKARELNSAITELGQSIKGFHKEQSSILCSGFS